MIFDQLVLRDFGVYRGEQTFCLTPLDKKPIVLFGGLNGGGKTTILDALQLVLFGRNAQLSNRKGISYHEYLARSIHTGVAKSEGAGITLIFRHQSGGKTETLCVAREWHVTKSGAVRERLGVTRDPYNDGAELDPLLTDAWSEHVNTFMPANIAPLFFFDGEKIETLADVDHAADVLATGIASLLGLDLVDQLIADLGVLERRKRVEDADDGTAQTIRAAEREIGLAKEAYREVFQQRAQAQNELDGARKSLNTAERAYKREGGQVFAERGALEAERSALTSQIAELEERLRGLAAGAAPLLLVEHELLARVAAQDAREVAASNATALGGVLLERDEALLRRAEDVGADRSLLDELARFLAEDRSARAIRAHTDGYLHLSDEARSHLTSLRTKVLGGIRAEAAELVERVAEKRQALAYLDGKLASVPSEDAIAAVHAQLNEAREQVAAAELKLHGLSEEVARRKKQLERQQKDLQRHVERERRDALSRDDTERLVRHSKRVRGTMKTFRTHLIARHVQRIETLILESFRQLLRKESLISGLRIDPQSFVVELTGRDGQPLAPSRLSAGERQLLAVSMLWGLARASGRPLPAVIDTPLGRLDSEHRTHLVTRYFPNASHQVLLLSTDEEIDRRYYAKLEPHVARSYVLEYDDATGATKSRDGYFPWKT